MKRSILFMMAVSAIAVLSCTKEINNEIAPEKEKVTMSFDATLGAPTKVELGESNGKGGYKVLWSKGDKIAVFTSDPTADTGSTQKNEFVTDIQSASAQATFSGEIEPANVYYAVYPYESAVSWSEKYDNMTVELPASQTANGIASGISIATADGTSLQFEHVTGYVKFTIPAEYTDIKEVRFSGNDSEPLVGKYYVYRDNGTTPNEFSNTKYSEVSLTPSSGSVFAPGTYYFTAFPAELDKGLTIKFINSSDEFATKATDDTKPATIVAGDILNLGTIEDLTFAAAYKHALPLEEDFSAVNVLKKYETIGAVSVETSNLAAGGDSPELMIKGGASLTANINLNGFSGDLTMSFNTNQRGRLSVTSLDGVDITELASNGNTYHLTVSVPENLDVLPLTISNTTSSENARFDNLLVTKATIQTIAFTQSSYMFSQGSQEAQSFTGQKVSDAKTSVTYVSDNVEVATVDSSNGNVTLTGGLGVAKITATAAATDDYRSASASYTIEIVSASAVKKTYTLTITTDDFNNTSYAANNNEKTSIAVANDNSEFEVKWVSNQVMLSSSLIQWQKSKGSIYNTTNLGAIQSVTVESSAGTFNQYIGSSAEPSEAGSGGFFKIQVGSATGKATKVTVVFER